MIPCPTPSPRKILNASSAGLARSTPRPEQRHGREAHREGDHDRHRQFERHLSGLPRRIFGPRREVRLIGAGARRGRDRHQDRGPRSACRSRPLATAAGSENSPTTRAWSAPDTTMSGANANWASMRRDFVIGPVRGVAQVPDGPPLRQRIPQEQESLIAPGHDVVRRRIDAPQVRQVRRGSQAVPNRRAASPRRL